MKAYRLRKLQNSSLIFAYCIICLINLASLQSQSPFTTVPTQSMNSPNRPSPSDLDYQILTPSSFEVGSTADNVVGLYVTYSIDNLYINPSDFLSNKTDLYTGWNVTEQIQTNEASINPQQLIFLLGDSVILDVDDLHITSDSDATSTIYYNINVDEGVLPQQRYEQYNQENNTSGFPIINDVECYFSGGGIDYNLQQSQAAPSVEKIITNGPINFGLLNGNIVIDIPDAQPANYIKIGKYLLSTNQGDKLAIDTLIFDDIFLSCIAAPDANPQNIKCFLVAREHTSNRIIIWDISFQDKTVIFTFKLLFTVTGSNDPNFVINLKNLEFYSNKLVIGIRNYGVATYNFFEKGTSTFDFNQINTLNNSTSCSSSSIFGIYSLSSSTYDFVLDQCYTIDFFNDFDIYQNALYVVSDNMGLSVIDLDNRKLYLGQIPHPFFKRLNLITNENLIFIGIEVDNAPLHGITEFFVEAVAKIDNLFNPTINKAYISEDLVIYDGVQSDENGMTILLDTRKSRLLVIIRSIPNTVNVPIFQINLDPSSFNNYSKIYPISLPNKPFNFLIQGTNSKWLLSDISPKKFNYGCGFNKEAEYTLTLDMDLLCSDLISTCHLVTTSSITVTSNGGNHIVIIIVVVIAITLIISLVVVLILCKKGYFKKIGQALDSKSVGHKYDNPHMESNIVKDAEKIDVDHQKLDDTN